MAHVHGQIHQTEESAQAVANILTKTYGIYFTSVRGEGGWEVSAKHDPMFAGVRGFFGKGFLGKLRQNVLSFSQTYVL
jgi:hypothetical protein